MNRLGVIDVWQVNNLPNVYYAQNPIRFNNDIVRESVK